MNEREYPEIPELEAFKKPQLDDWAKKLDIEGRSDMNTDELRAALIESVGQEKVRRSLGEEGVGDDARLDALEARMNSLEGRIAAIDARTAPSTQILGS